MRGKVTINVIGVDLLAKELQSKIDEIVSEALFDYMDDLSEVSSAFAPKKTGQLETTYIADVKRMKHGWRGRVTFRAMNGDFNYAIVMHEGFYNLGPISRTKPGGSSKYGMVSQEVGRRYLGGPFEQLVNPYMMDLAKRIATQLR
jgi:hypothetical protein